MRRSRRSGRCSELAMTDRDRKDPLDTFDESDADMELLAAEVDAVMASMLETMTPSPESLIRLQSAVATPPQRYAPFYDRVAELFDLPREAVVAELARLAAPNVWRFAGLPGVRNVAVQ